MNSKENPAPALIIIFGVKGDLTRRKLVPALYNLYIGNHLPEIFAIYCIDFQNTDEKAFQRRPWGRGSINLAAMAPHRS